MRGQYIVILALVSALVITTSSNYTIAEVIDTSGPFVDKIQYRVFTGDDQVLALQNNEVDLIGDAVDPSFLSTLESAENIETSTYLRNGYGYLCINTAKYPFNFTSFRRAFAFALNKTATAEGCLAGGAEPLDSLIPKINPFSCEGLLPYSYYEPNIEQGNSMLDVAGFGIDPISGYRDAPNGDPFNVIIEFAQSTCSPGEIGDAVENAFHALHIDATAVATDFYEYLNRLYFHGDYDMVFLGDNFDDFNVDWIANEFNSESADEPYYNFPNWQNTTFDSWRDQLLHGTDYEDVYEAAFKMQEIFVHACPMVILYESKFINAYRTDQFEGYVNDALSGTPCWWTNQRIRLKEPGISPYGGTFRWSNPLDIDSFNFMTSQSAYTNNVLQMLYDPLFKYDPHGNLIPWLVESYAIETHDDNPKIQSGNTRFTLEIAKNATWTDGTPLTAEDVAFSYSYYYQAENSPYSQDLSQLFGAYALTDYTCIIEFNDVSYWHISKLTLPIIPYHIFSDIGVENWSEWQPEVGDPTFVTSGPFFVSDYIAGEYVELTVNPYYFRGLIWDRIESIRPTTSTVETISSTETAIPASENQKLIDISNLNENEKIGTSAGYSILSDEEDITLTWTSNDSPIPTDLFSANIVDGDHIVVNASYQPKTAQNITLELSAGIYFNQTQSLVVPDNLYDPFIGTIDPTQFSWMTISGIREGDYVEITANFTNNDSDFLAWWDDTDSSTWTYLNNLLGDQMVFESKPEVGYIEAERAGSLRVACFDYGLQPGTWNLIVDTRVIWTVSENDSSVSFDTYNYGKNVTVDVRVYGYNTSGEYFEGLYSSITLNNFFGPDVQLLSPSGGEYWTGDHEIIWQATSRNIDNEMRHDVYISKDGGKNYQLYAANLKSTNVTWYLSLWKFETDFVVKIITIDRGMFGSDVSDDALISAGNWGLVDTTPPQISGSHDRNLEYWFTGRIIGWLIIDINPDTYTIFVDGVEFYGDQNFTAQRNLFLLSCDGLATGVHNFTVIAVDQLMNRAENTIIVVVGGEITSTTCAPTYLTSSESSSQTSGSSTTMGTTSHPTSPTTPVFWEGVIQLMMAGITLVSFTVIIVFSLLIIKHRKTIQ